MLINNLSILMKERNVKNAVLSLKTGISKNTISQLSNNKNSMIQMETINKICQVLDILPNDFFEYSPYDVSFGYEIEEGYNCDDRCRKVDVYAVILITKNNNDVDEFVLEGYQQEEAYNFDKFYISDEDYSIKKVDLQLNKSKKQKLITDYFSIQLVTYIKNQLSEFIFEELNSIKKGLITNGFHVEIN